MANWHGYMIFENLALSPANRQILTAELENIGTANSGQRPEHRNHWRTRLDNEAALFEALFDASNLTVAAFEQRLATIFGVDVATIDTTLQNVTYDTLVTPVATFARLGTDYIRAAVFGGPSSTWEQSRIEALAFLAANSAAWEAAE